MVLIELAYNINYWLYILEKILCINIIFKKLLKLIENMEIYFDIYVNEGIRLTKLNNIREVLSYNFYHLQQINRIKSLDERGRFSASILLVPSIFALKTFFLKVFSFDLK